MSLTTLQIDKVDPMYFVRSKRLDVGEETRISATHEEAVRFAESTSAGPPPNFITEIFFLTAACFRLGLLKVDKDFANLSREAMQYFGRMPGARKMKRAQFERMYDESIERGSIDSPNNRMRILRNVWKRRAERDANVEVLASTFENVRLEAAERQPKKKSKRSQTA